MVAEQQKEEEPHVDGAKERTEVAACRAEEVVAKQQTEEEPLVDEAKQRTEGAAPRTEEVVSEKPKEKKAEKKRGKKGRQNKRFPRLLRKKSRPTKKDNGQSCAWVCTVDLSLSLFVSFW